MRRRNGAGGFTLIEIILVVVLTGILASVAVPIILIGVDAIHYDQKRNNLVETARFVMDRIGLEVQGIKNSSGVVTATATKYEFNSSQPCPNGAPANPRRVTFSMHATEADSLMQTVVMTCGGTTTNVSSLLLGYVDQLTFTYYGSGGVLLNSPQTGASTDIESVRVKFRVRDPQLTGRFEAPYTMVGEFRPRNLRQETEFLP